MQQHAKSACVRRVTKYLYNMSQTHYIQQIVPELQNELGYGNVHQVPRLRSVTLNVGVGKIIKEPNAVEHVEATLATITGQKPVRTKAKKSIAGFKIRQ